MVVGNIKVLKTEKIKIKIKIKIMPYRTGQDRT
jgi:hypothetical protein